MSLGNDCSQRRFLKMNIVFPLKLYGSSVDAYWHPLTPEHGFPSLIYITQGAPPQSATYVDIRFLLSPEHKKTGDTFWMPPVKNLYYDFLRRHYPHQVKGRSLITSSQPAFTSSPVFLLI